MALSLLEYRFLLQKSCWVLFFFFCSCFSFKFSEPATKTHFEPCKYSSLCPESCETTDSYLQARHLITEIWEQHASPPIFISLPRLGSPRCDSISGRLVEIATRQQCLIDRRMVVAPASCLSHFLSATKSSSSFSFIIFFLISFFIRCAFIGQASLR